MISMLKTKRLLLKLLAIFGIVLILNIVNRLESRQPEEEIRESIAGVSVYNEERQLKDLLIFDYKTDRQFILTYTFQSYGSEGEIICYYQKYLEDTGWKFIKKSDNIDYSNNKKLKELVKLISDRGYELDYNIAGLFKEDCGEVYISGYLAELIKKYNVKVVLGSDSHSSKFIDKYKINI